HSAAPSRALPPFPPRRSSDLRPRLASSNREPELHDRRAVGGLLPGLRVPPVAALGGDPLHLLHVRLRLVEVAQVQAVDVPVRDRDRKSTRLNSSHRTISYAAS